MFNFSSPYQDPGFDAWKQGLRSLPSSEVRIREAEPTAQDGRWMEWMQADCKSTYIQSVEHNLLKIKQQLVFLAEIAEYPVGFCQALVGRTISEPLFIQMTAVVPLARRRGAGLALLRAAAMREPKRSIVMAVLEDNVAAQRLNERFATSIDGNTHRVPLRGLRRSELGLAQGERHRPWMIDRSQVAD